MATLADFVSIHERLERIFGKHQELLLERRLHEARALLHVYRALMGLHMRHEEKCLLPVYVAIGPNPTWPIRLYAGQHRRMREFLAGATDRLELIRGGRAEIRPEVIGLLDYETTYKHLVEHHEDAERQGLFAALEFELDGVEQASLVDPCIAEWRHAEHLLMGTGSGWP
jgi:hypothetical protein